MFLSHYNTHHLCDLTTVYKYAILLSRVYLPCDNTDLTSTQRCGTLLAQVNRNRYSRMEYIYNQYDVKHWRRFITVGRGLEPHCLFCMFYNLVLEQYRNSRTVVTSRLTSRKRLGDKQKR